MQVGGEKLGGSFKWLNVTQFLGALNDNVFKLLIILFLIAAQSAEAASIITALAGAIFVIPFLLFSAFAGRLADRFSKRNIIISAKVAEGVIMLAGTAAFILKSAFGLYLVLFIMAAQSAFFAPAKYGIVPELVKKQQLSKANGSLEALTYLAIVIGTALGPFLTQATGGRFALMGLICFTISVIGFSTGLRIERTAPAGAKTSASVFFVKDICRTVWSIRRDKDLLLAVIASAYFLLIGGFIYSNLIPYGISHLGLSETQSGYLFVLAAMGIGTGAFWAGRLSGRTVEFGIVPLGAMGLTLSSAGLGLITARLYPTFVLVVLMGISAGLFIVPIHAFIQLRSPNQRRGEILATSSFLGWVGVLLASALIYCFTALWRMSASQVFMALGLMTLAPTLATIILLPDFLVRFICIVLTKLCYRIKVFGIENVPADKGVLLVSNHVSWVDPLFLGATQQRRIRFLMDKKFYRIWWLKPICKLMRVIPISAEDPPKKIITALKQARLAMDQGFVVCVFAEGAITRNAMLRSFRGGFERIMKGTDYNVVPVYIGGAWGSIFSYRHGKMLSRLPKKFPHPVSVHFGRPMPAGSSASKIRQKVTELACDYFDSLKSGRRSLAHRFVKIARKRWRKRCISDSTGKKLNYGKTLVSAITLADEINKFTHRSDKIGILLPPSAAGAITNLAVTLLGKTSVNLNYTTGQQAMLSAIEQCGIETIISSRKFMEKAQIPVTLPGFVLLEDITKDINPRAKLKAFLKAQFMPMPLLVKKLRHNGDDLAAIIFSSGSSGRPKGVMLSHHNIISNIEAIKMVIQMKYTDDLCGVLPFFHSFGFNCGLWLPLISGVSVSYIANPLDGKMVGDSIRQNRTTILFSPPTFLTNYIRRSQRDDFKSLRLVVAGAEKLKKRLADSFQAKFGIRPLEGYGATELSPVVSLNIPDVEADGVYQIGTKPGTIGHPIPGVAVKIADLEGKGQLGIGQEGLLMVKGPNVMLGYLGMPEKTEQAIKDTWYNTGDIAKIDEDGFLTITGRLSRFSKIAGEMVPHIGIEQVYLDALNTDEQVVAVTGVPDTQKGEELIVFYLEEAGPPEKLNEIIKKSNLPNLWKPKRDNYIKIESIPLLGSGKLDIMKLKEIALKSKK